MKVEFYRHHLNDEEITPVLETLRTIFLTTGPKNTEFEARFAEYLGVKEVVTTSSCTAALHLALAAVGIGPGDEVLTTPMSFIATANAVLMVGATPVFVDVDPQTGLIDLDRLDTAVTARTKAVIPVHLYGQMVDMRRLRAWADRHHLVIIEDAAHASEARRDGVRPGQLGDAACFSFYATKNMTCGEGGALATHRAELAHMVRQFRNHGMTKSADSRYTGRYQHWDMEHFGWKYNLSNFQAAMLIPQIGRLEERLARREQIARRYEKACDDANIGFPRVLPGDNVSARHLFTIWVNETRRDDLLGRIQEAGVGVAVNYRPIHLTAHYRKRFGYGIGDFPHAEAIGSRTISIPLYPGLGLEEVEHVVSVVTNLGGN